MKIIDLRSDTVTHPTQAMRSAMANAVVGDDVLDEDPTVKQLQNLAAIKTGKDAALFVPSGTMGNLIAILTHCSRGDEIIVGDQSHIFLNEVGGAAGFGGVQTRQVPNQKDGTISHKDLSKAIREEELHYPETRLICLENTHNYCSGFPLTKDYTNSVWELARKHSLKIHLDGARIFNAAVALSTDVKNLTKQTDSVMFCLSKGLSAPVGSLLCGTENFIRKAHKIRKMAGGGMRQAGHLAAAGLIALEELIDRLKEDHEKAQILAQGLSGIPGIEINPKNVKTNIIFFDWNNPEIKPKDFLIQMKAKGILCLMTAPKTFRMVLHREVSSSQTHLTLETIKAIIM
tara:strand:- start:4738 stop:5772 length:1035 start_codon:yes stop_codon:yes gene_type:complete